MTSLQIREVPEDLHRRLKARAALNGQSLSEYALSAATSRVEARRERTTEERRPPNQHSAPGRPPPASQRTRDRERWRRIARGALALVGTVFVALPIGLFAIVFALDAATKLGVDTTGQMLAGLLLLGIPSAYAAWRFARRLRRIAQAARDEDESWLTVRTVRAKQGPLRSVMAEHGVLGVCAAVVMLAVFAYRAGRPPRSERSRRRVVGRIMTVLGGVVVVIFIVLLIASGVAFGVGALTGSDVIGGVAGYAAMAAIAGCGVVAVRRRRRLKAETT